MILLLSCKTIDIQETGALLSPVDPQSDLFLLVQTETQQQLVDSLMTQMVPGGQLSPAVVEILQQCRWIFLSQQNELWKLDLYGDFPSGKIKFALGADSQWKKTTWQNRTWFQHQSSPVMLTLEGKDHIWIFSSCQPSEEHEIYISDSNQDPYSLQIRISEGGIKELQKQIPGLNAVINTLELSLMTPDLSGSYPAEIKLSGMEGNSRALTALGKVSMLSLVGRNIMDASIEIDDPEVRFYGFSISPDKWAGIYRSLFEGVQP